jgi:Ran GTPase-activating protein (RanGAP) involved in mRNA processing and transport
MTKEDVYNKPMYFALDQIDFSGDKTNLMSRANFNLKHIQGMTKPEWPKLIHFAAKCKDTITSWALSTQSDKDMEIMAHMIGENPIGKCGFSSMNMTKCKLGKEGAKMFAPALKVNTSLLHLDLSSCKLGVSGMYSFSKALIENKTLKSLNLYRNILDVDGARSIGKMLQVNKSLEFLDIGHNRIRETGLKAIVDGILLNKDCKLSQLSICANFINDDGVNMLFDRLVIGPKQQLTHVYIKKNFQSEYNKILLATRVADKKIKVFVDDFRSIDYLVKEKLEKSIWISPFSVNNSVQELRDMMKYNEIGFITDIRVARGHKAPGRPQENHFCLIEFQDTNSVNRSLQLASKGKAIFGGIKARIYRSGTQTAICMP